jgi:hypothetical protein
MVIHPLVDQHRIRELQRTADILFLPLAFASPYPEIIRTSSPTKLGEYLCAGRPILVHAPSDSHLAQFARERGFGVVVDQPGPELLVDAILEIMRDLSLRSVTAAHARDTASLFDHTRTVDEFHSVLRVLLPRRSW